MITYWEVPFILRSTTLGDLNINQDLLGNRRYQLVPAACDDRVPLRVTRTPIPAADGMIPNERFTEGYLTTLAIQLYADGGPACDSDLVEMTDDLMGWLRSMLNMNNEGRLLWTPDGHNQRMHLDVRWNEEAVWTLDDPGGFSRITFGLDTPYPYAMDAAQTTTAVTTAGATLNNTGNTKFWPVIKVYGPTSSFTIENTTTGEAIVYLGPSLPGGQSIGGGEYAEIDTFRNTIFLNGDEDDLAAGVVIEDSDFWGLEVGNNVLDSSGPNFDVLWNIPWI